MPLVSWLLAYFYSSLQDVSGNELQALPAELCSLPSLRDLSVRRNQLSTLPDGEENEELEGGGGWRGGSMCVYTGELTKTLHRTSVPQVQINRLHYLMYS